MKLDVQKRLAAKVLKIGLARVWFDPSRLDDIKEAITKEDIKSLIKQGAIKAKRVRGVAKKRRKRRRGPGRRKGAKKARTPKKRRWISKVRAQRRFLKRLREKGILNPREYRKIYSLIKGGAFKSVSHLKTHIKKLKEG
jgi:large subunit ribosomal protein L19e